MNASFFDLLFKKNLLIRFILLFFCGFFFLLQPSKVLSAQFTKEQLFQLATLAAKDEQYDQAIDLYKKAIEMDPKFAPAYNSIGLVCQSRPDPDMNEAVRYFRLAVDIDPRFTESWNNLGRSYYALAQFSPADKALTKSLEINPNQPEIELTLAWILLLGESKAADAIERFNHVLETLDNEMAYYGRGLAYLLTGERYHVIDAITQLRRRSRNDLAEKLEKMMAEKVRLISEEGRPLVTGDGSEKSVFDEQLKMLEGHGFSAGNSGDIKVRLKGPLNF